MKKKCSFCGEEYPATPEYFHRNKSRPDGLRYWCKKCRSENYKKHPQILRNRNFKYKYGMTLQGYETLYEFQKGKCAICGLEKKLEVDHNHKTGKIRELLCSPCNNMIRGENPLILIKGAKYLQKWR